MISQGKLGQGGGVVVVVVGVGVAWLRRCCMVKKFLNLSFNFEIDGFQSFVFCVGSGRGVLASLGGSQVVVGYNHLEWNVGDSV